MDQRAISSFILVLVFGLSLEACQNQSSMSQKGLTETSLPSQAKTSPSVPLKIQPLLANYKTYDDAQSLETSAELIVIGRPQASLETSQASSIPESEKAKKKQAINESVVVRDEQGLIIDRYTITPVKVQKVIKGNVMGKEINVLQPAAVVQEANQPPFISLIEGYSPLQKNTKYLLFLKEVDTQTYPNLAGVYSIMSVNQGKFNFDKVDKEETNEEAKNTQYRELKARIRQKFEGEVNATP